MPMVIPKTRADYDPDNPPMMAPDEGTLATEIPNVGGTEDLENRAEMSRPGSIEDLESRRGPRMNPMLAKEHGIEEPSPQGPPPTGKEQFHNTMADFGHRAEANRAAMIGLDPEDPEYVKKLSALQAQHGALTEEKARYQMLHPWGGPESAHPGILGKIGHVAGTIGNVAGNALLGKGNMSAIPGSEANLEAKNAAGEKEITGAEEGAQKAATTAETEARVPEIAANVEHLKQETENLKNPPDKVGLTPEAATLHDLMTGDNGNPRVNPQTQQPYTYLEAFQATQGAIQGAKPERTKTPEEQFIEDFFKQNPGATMGDAIRAYATASQRPEKPGAGEGRADKSYQFNANRLDKLAAPIEQRAERIGRLEDTLNQNNPQADSLIAPELLTVMAGGQGSGLRMNEAEIARIIGGRPQWENIKAKLAAWQLDPNKPFAFQPAQREQIRGLFAAIRQRIAQKAQILDEGRAALIETDDPKEHRQIVQQIQHRLDSVDSGKGGGNTPNRPPNVPADYVYNAHGEKGAGWYKPKAAAK